MRMVDKTLEAVNMTKLATLTMSTALFLLLAPGPARAHCDAEDGPVAKAASKALDTGKVGHALAWVQPSGEAEIKRTFQEVVEVRKQGGKARALADRYFLETLVRVHRQGEGAPYTGIKPAGGKIGPAISAADRAVASGSPRELEKLLVETVRHGLHERMARVKKTSKWDPSNAAAGREHVAAYVDLLHFAEGIYKTAHGGHHEGEARAEAETGTRAGTHERHAD